MMNDCHVDTLLGEGRDRDIRSPSLDQVLAQLVNKANFVLDSSKGSVEFRVVSDSWFVETLLKNDDAQYVLVQKVECPGWVDVDFEQHIWRFRKRVLVSSEMARQAARHFYNCGGRDPELSWQPSVDMMPDSVEEP